MNVKSIVLVSLWLWTFQSAAHPIESTTQALVKGHTDVAFSVKHMLISTTRGVFKDFSGEFELDEKNQTVKNVSIIIKTDSIFTNDTDRDGHLKNEDFFDVKKYPEMVFKIDSLKYKLNSAVKTKGKLTIRNQARDIPVEITFNGFKESPFDKKRYGGFKLKSRIDRKDFGMTFNKTMDQGGLAIANEVDIDISGEFLKK